MRINDWRLLYSSAHDGASMIKFYEKTANYSGTIMLIRDINRNVYGGYANGAWKISKYFYGTGESFLFSFYVIA